KRDFPRQTAAKKRRRLQHKPKQNRWLRTRLGARLLRGPERPLHFQATLPRQAATSLAQFRGLPRGSPRMALETGVWLFRSFLPYPRPFRAALAGSEPSPGVSSSRPRGDFFEELAPILILASACARTAAAGATRIASARSVPAISVANCFPGSCGSISRHACRIRIHTHMTTIANPVPTAVNSPRGGNDFFVGTTAASSTFTLGTSLASSTFASSYCCVSSS